MKMDKSVLFKNINEGILSERYDAFKRNLNKNREYIGKFGGLQRIIPKFNSKNVIVVGAGPSLESELDVLKRYQYRREIIIISTDMALGPLVKSGIYPEYVISCETTPVDFFNSISTDEMHLLAFSCLSNVNLRRWRGNISFYNWMIHNPMYDELWKIAGPDLGFVATGGIVTTQAVSLALGCNIKSLMLIGNDLGFCREFYIKESTVYYNNLNKSSRFTPVEAIEYNTIRKRREYTINRGERIYYTNNQFLAAKLWLEELFNRISIPIYDSSVPGCTEGTLSKMELKQYLDKFDRKSKRKRR